MRIGFIAEAYPPTDGGVATSAQRVARGLVAQGAEVQLFCFDNSLPISVSDYVVEQVDEGVVVFRVGPFFLKQRDLNLNLLSEKAKASLRRRAFNQIVARINPKLDVVLSFYLVQSGFIAQFVARQLGVPHVAGVRGNDIGLNIFHLERFAATHWTISGAQRIVCVNEYLRERLLLAFPEVKDRTSVIPNSVKVSNEQIPDPLHRQRVLQATGWNETDFIVTFIGTLREKKGIVPLLNALYRVKEKPIRLLIVGPQIRNSDAALCQDLLASLTESRHIFTTGFVDRSEVKNWALGSDAVVMPSTDDGLANGLLEGMSMGLCPIVSDLFSETVIHRENGLLVCPGDDASLAQCFLQLETDRELAKRLGRCARQFVESVHPPLKEASAYLELLRTTITDSLHMVRA